MICPACNDEMIVVEYKQIELDFCPACRGVWFDANELELLLDALEFLDQKADGLFRSPADTAAEAARKCPYCRSRMEKVVMGSGKDVLIDRCLNGHGLWFDGGELDTVIGSLQKDESDGGVGSFLADALFADDDTEDNSGKGEGE
jgi:uncharacterized protein